MRRVWTRVILTASCLQIPLGRASHGGGGDGVAVSMNSISDRQRYGSVGDVAGNCNYLEKYLQIITCYVILYKHTTTDSGSNPVCSTTAALLVHTVALF